MGQTFIARSITRLFTIGFAIALAGCTASAPRQGLVNLDTYKSDLVAYQHSGDYARHVADVGIQAEQWLVTEAPRVKNPAIVLDIDETSLSNWDELAANALTFRMDGPCDHLPKGPCGLHAWQLKAAAQPLGPTLHLYRTARAMGVAVFFITGRDETVREATERNLHKAGYESWTELVMRPAHSGTQSASDYKAPQRARIEAKGYRIVLNIGDQASDLAGGHAERIFKVPNPYYYIP